MPTEPHTADPAAELQKANQYITLGRLNLRIEYLFLGALAVFGVSIAAGFFFLDLGADDFTGRFGYPMLWVISLIRASAVLVPIPTPGLTLGAGAVMDPVWGIPAPLMVGLTVGTAESIGEFTGYAAGMSGGRLLEGKSLYEKVRASIQKRAYTTMFVLALAPSPVFDVGGIAAGAARLPIRVFYPPVLVGKIIRGTVIAAAGFYGFGLISSFF
jgi:uncharacterized membrane protein YdjX (TVP38/TMEM64 family)